MPRTSSRSPPRSSSKILEKERPTPSCRRLGGQTGLNTALALPRPGDLEKSASRCSAPTPDVIARPRTATCSGRDDQDRARVRALGDRQDLDDARRVLAQIGLPCVIRPAFTMGGAGGGIAYNVEEFEDIVSPRPRRSRRTPRSSSRSPAGLEGVRDGGDARRQGQRRHHLLHREPRPDGRPHRRLHHGRARADAHRPRVPGHAQRVDRDHARDRRRDAAARTASSRSTPKTAASSSSR